VPFAQHLPGKATWIRCFAVPGCAGIHVDQA
jgi:hypothetical protein